MQITHVVNSLDPAKGGPPLVASRLAVAQALNGHNTRLVSFVEPDIQSRIDKLLAALPASSRFEIEYLAASDHIGRSRRLSKQKLISTLVDSEIVHFHGVWERAIRWGIAGIRGKVPYVVTPHGMLDPWCLAQKAWKKKLALRLVFRKLLNGANFLHVLNEDENALLAPLQLSCPVEIVANGIFTEEFDKLPPPGTFYNDFPELEGRPFILFLGRLHYKKGLDYLADAFRRVADEIDSTCLVVAGPDDGAQTDFVNRIRSHNLKDRVFLTGGLYAESKIAALVDAQCFCLPSRQEGFSIAILEALACRTPVVVSTECHFPEIASAEAGFVVPLIPEKIADKLILLLEEPSLRSEFGNRARSLVESRFTWEKLAQDMVDCYCKYLGQ